MGHRLAPGGDSARRANCLRPRGFRYGRGNILGAKELADEYHVVLVDRRGYGDSPPAGRLDFESQVDDILGVVGDGLIWWGSPPVGYSACWLRPRTRVFAGSAAMSPQQFVAAFYEAFGFDPQSGELDERHAVAAVTTAREPVAEGSRPNERSSRAPPTILSSLEDRSMTVSGLF